MRFATKSWRSLGTALRSPTKGTSQRFSQPSPGSNGSFTPSRPSAVRNTFCTTWLVTRIESPFRITALLSVDNNSVTFRWKDYAHQGKNRTMTLSSLEFLRRFVQHVLPKGFPRIRYFGWMANRRRAGSLLLCRSLLARQSAPRIAALATLSAAPAEWQCPHCFGLTPPNRAPHARADLIRKDGGDS